jgi:hypothetical protein
MSVFRVRRIPATIAETMLRYKIICRAAAGATAT